MPTATRQCLVPVLPRRARTSFPGREAAALRGSFRLGPERWLGRSPRRQRQLRHAVLAWGHPSPWFVRPPQQRHCPPAHEASGRRPPRSGNTGNGLAESLPSFLGELCSNPCGWGRCLSVCWLPFTRSNAGPTMRLSSKIRSLALVATAEAYCLSDLHGAEKRWQSKTGR